MLVSQSEQNGHSFLVEMMFQWEEAEFQKQWLGRKLDRKDGSAMHSYAATSLEPVVSNDKHLCLAHASMVRPGFGWSRQGLTPDHQFSSGLFHASLILPGPAGDPVHVALIAMKSASQTKLSYFNLCRVMPINIQLAKTSHMARSKIMG